MALSEKLYTLRRKSGLSQEQLAEQLNVSRQAISKWEAGQSIPESDKLLSISNYFNVSLDYLMKEDETQDAISDKEQTNTSLQTGIVLFISSKLKRVSTSYVATVGIVVVPSAIYYFIGISPLKIISTTVPVSATSLLLNTQGALSGIVIVGLIMIGIAVICACLVRKQQSSN